MIGIFLDIPSAQLDVIKLNNPNNANGCCTDLFIKWLKGTENVTWEKMFEVIDQLSIDSTGSGTVTATTIATSK